ncbi:NAD(P)-binding protein [Aspergillus campestris IBT 28561]|uniref:NAD(P)-binding protein n=1 Tax=Aspergillus campestris (strain IBT 28561) TaxID=1392248 RepID=A0A2I1D8T3_ASPC2|nr:NAD(P)-binding protein [Aspergillus campestris IBT 28561]PKY06268.1 NAD(P)-binding protein [Aspergillus campestris IBT 28561]
MAIIAVAGGTGNVGRAIVEILRDTTNHPVYVLTRQADDDLAKELGVALLSADYSNVASLTNLLESNKIDTVISTVSIMDDTTSNAQLNLIEAAENSSSTNRFIPSEFGLRYTQEHAALFPPITGKLAAAQKLQSSPSLEYSLIATGFFLDYYGMPKVKSYLKPFVCAVDVAHNTAAIPGSGDVPVAFTHTFDVARFIAALVGAPDWPERSTIIGDKKTWNEMVAIAEEVKGVRFNVTHDSEEKLKTFQATELPSHPSMYAFMPKEQLQYILATFGRWSNAGGLDLPEDESLNRRFPEIQPRSVRDVLEEGWKA